MTIKDIFHKLFGSFDQFLNAKHQRRVSNYNHLTLMNTYTKLLVLDTFIDPHASLHPSPAPTLHFL